MSRAYRPRLSKDKAVAQRVGEALERERVERFSVAKQIAAFKSLEDSSYSQTSEVAGTADSVSRRARAIAAAKPTPAAKRKRAPVTAAESSSETKSGDGKTVVPSTKTVPPNPGKAAHDKSQRTRYATSGTDTPASCGSDEKRGWSCPSCSFLNRETASQCSMCSTRHFRSPSETSRRSSSSKVRNSSTLTNEPKTQHRGGMSLSCSERETSSSSRSNSRKTEIAASTDAVTSIAKSDGPDLAGGHSANGSEGRKSSTSSAFAEGKGGGRGKDEGDKVHGQPLSNSDDPDRGVEQSCATRAAEDRSTTDSDSPEAAWHKRGKKRAITPAHSILSLPVPKGPFERSRGACSPPQRDTPGSGDGANSEHGADLSSDTPRRRNARHGATVAGINALSVPETRVDHAADVPARLPSASTLSKALRAPMGMSQQKVIYCRDERRPVVVTPLKRDETDEQAAASIPESTLLAEIGDDAVVSTAAAPSDGVPRGSSWPTVARAARLDFRDRSARWEVSSVVVTKANCPEATARTADGRRNDASAGTGAAVIVCHSGGVSVWGLTDTAAVCTHLSPALAGATTEKVRVRFYAAAVFGGSDGVEGFVSSKTNGYPRGMRQTCIVAVGRHEADPGPPVIRMWQGSRLGYAENVGLTESNQTETEGSSALAPATLTTTLKKKFAAFFPPMAPRNISPCLCVCEHSVVVGNGEDGRGVVVEGDGRSGKITLVMALGGKAVRLVCAPGWRGSEEIRAKSLPTGAVGNSAVFTSLAPVPSNSSLVWASLPSSNTVLLWDTRELQLLFTLPLDASSICVPAVVLPYSLVAARDDGHAGLDAVASSVRRRRTAAEPDSRLLCVLGAAGMNECEIENSGVNQKEGCDLFGICCSSGDAGGAMGPQGCVVSALRLEGNEAGKIGGDGATGRNQQGQDVAARTNLQYLSDGGGCIVGVDNRRSEIVARDVLTGDTRVLVRTDAADELRFSSIGIDNSVGVLAVAVGDLERNCSTAVELFVLSDSEGPADIPRSRDTTRQ